MLFVFLSNYVPSYRTVTDKDVKEGVRVPFTSSEDDDFEATGW